MWRPGFIDMRGLKRIVSNFGWMAAEQIVRLLVGIFIGVFIARHLGPDQFGALSFALSFSSLIGIFSALGLNRIVIRELALNPTNLLFQSRLVSSVFAIRILAGFGSFLLAISVSIVAHQGDPFLIGIVAFGFVFGAFDVIDQSFQARSKTRLSVIARSSAFFIASALKVALLLHDATVTAFAVVAMLEVSLSAFALSLAYRSEGLSLQLHLADLRYGCCLLKESWSEIFAGFACLVFMRIDQIMLGNMIGQEAVGIYSVASRLAEAWYFFPTALVASTFPAIVRLRETDQILYLRRLHQLLVVLVIVAYIIGAVVTLFSEWIICLLYGQAYIESASVLVVLVWCGVFVSFGVASGSWIMAERRPILNLTRNALGAVTNVGLNYLLIPKYGVQGAAFGTLISQFVAYFASDFVNPYTRSIGWLKLKSIFLVWK